uniref:NB-ARC domain-containing protein n=1 Tax=Leersia perrieri TaxID=77586 RepID=A0A0D9Y0G2_9ORYZ
MERTMSLLTSIKTRHRIAMEIQNLKSRVVQSSDRRARYKVDDSIVSKPGTTGVDPRLLALYADVAGLVGIDGPRDELVDLLMEKDMGNCLKVVSIVGFGGLGKTTLAGEVYHKLEGQFQCQAFVSMSQKPDMKKILINILMSQKPDMKKILINILSQVSQQECIGKEACSEQQLIDVPRKFLKDKRCPHHLQKVCDEILKKCGGMPLAIITVASLLADKASDREEWMRVRNSICSTIGKNPDFEEMKKILLLSYNDLPYHLKICLLYLSVFPEDYVIKRDRLVRRWIAEGFISSDLEHDQEEIGQCYFADLINRGMIQPVGIQYDGQAKACRVHDMILDLIISKSAEENFVTLLGDQNNKFAQQDKVRRLSIDCRSRKHIMLPPMTVASHVRALTIFGSADPVPPPSNFRFLRRSAGKQIPQTYWEAFSVKYMRLSIRRIDALPEQLGDLYYLETLDLRGTIINKLPKSIVRLQRLACLLVDGLELPEGIGNMRALQELSFIKINRYTSASSLQELGSLSRLKILDLNCCFSIYTDHLVTSLTKLGVSSLRSLKVQIYSCSFFDPLSNSWFPPPYLLQEFQMTTDYYFPKIPKWIASLDHLSYLDINVNPVEDIVFQILGNLPALAFLWISSKATTGGRLTIGSDKFLHLKEFNFTCWNSREGLVFEAGAMPKLEKLHIPYNACDASYVHGELDFGIQHLSSLKHLHANIVCYGAKVGVIEALECAIRNTAGQLPSVSTLQIRRWGCEDVINDEKQQIGEPEASSSN